MVCFDGCIGRDVIGECEVFFMYDCVEMFVVDDVEFVVFDQFGDEYVLCCCCVIVVLLVVLVVIGFCFEFDYCDLWFFLCGCGCSQCDS